MSTFEFTSRRSPIVCTGGCVASSQPLATQIGLDILKKGGNAADAAVAVAAALNVTEPASTGIGGDCFCLYYTAETKKVYGLNGSGRCPRALSLEVLNQQGFNEDNPLPPTHAHNVTVPGAAAAWVDTVSLYGSKKLSLQEILRPATELAEYGFPVSEVCSFHWNKAVHKLQTPNNKYGPELLVNGHAPQPGQLFRNPSLANTFKGYSRVADILGDAEKDGMGAGIRGVFYVNLTDIPRELATLGYSDFWFHSDYTVRHLLMRHLLWTCN